MASHRISVMLADDNLIVREGVRMLLGAADDIEVVAVATDYESLVAEVATAVPQVVVTDIRMPPSFTDEGIRGAREVRKRNPGTGVVVLAQFEEPEYAIDLLREQADGCAYLLKDRVGDGDQLIRAIRTVSTGGSMLDPRIVELMMQPVTDHAGLSQRDEALLRQVAEGGESVLSQPTLAALHGVPPDVDALPAQLVKGRRTPVAAFKIHAA